ncbi:MAG: peptidoglycan DD-metalloendopeptidase family protein, partial [Thermodesulfobacteriota bacterium]
AAEEEARRRAAAEDGRRQREQTAAQAPPAPVKGSSGFAAQRGRLEPPVAGTVITEYGRHQEGRYGISTVQNGIDIQAAPGSQVRAVYSGRVVYADSLKGYGLLLIVDHGQQFYSLISRAARLTRKVGDEVKTGEVVGFLADDPELAAEGLHFEIRQGVTPEDPMRWLNHARLTVKGVKRADSR